MALVLVRAIFSWLPAEHRHGEVYAFLWRATEPVLARMRRVVPPVGGMDLSPIVVIVAGQVLIGILRG